MILVVVAMLATPTSESRAGGSLQLSQWVTLEDAGDDRTVLYQAGEIFEFYLTINHSVWPGDEAIEVLLIMNLSERFSTTLWRGSTILMGSEANGTLHLELRGVTTDLSMDRTQQLKGMAHPSRSHQQLAHGLAFGDDPLDTDTRGVEDETRQILLPPTSQGEGPAFRWRYAPQSQLFVFFLMVSITFEPSGNYALQVER